MFSTEAVVFNGQSAKIAFWHSDETEPFLVFAEVDKMIYTDEHFIEVFNKDYKNPIAVVKEWSFWKIFE